MHDVLSFSYTQGEEQLPVPEASIEREVQFVREQPDFIGQLQIGWAVSPKIKLFVDQFFISESYSKSLQTQDDFTEDGSRFRMEPAYNLDLSGRWNVSNNFTGYFSITNLFDAQYGGLSATGTPDDLLFNPQSGILWKLGLSYRLD